MKKIKSEKGASLVEYGILAGLISVAVIGSALTTGEEIETMFSGYVESLADGFGGDSESLPEAPAITDPGCYNAANVGTVGQVGWTGCEGMLIVDNTSLKAAGASYSGGDGSYQIVTGDGTFTFEDDGSNIFTGQVTDTNQLFARTNFSGDISYWDMRNVTSTAMMFAQSTSFNGDISGWKLDSLVDASGTFWYASNFNQDISNWNVDAVIEMDSMFEGATNFNQDLSGWNTSSVTDMGYMFSEASSFNQDLSGWNVSSVTPPFGFDADATAWVLPKPVFS